MEAAGIEPACRDGFTEASTCVVAWRGFARRAPKRQTAGRASRKRSLAAPVFGVERGESELATGSQVSPTKALSRGYRC